MKISREIKESAETKAGEHSSVAAHAATDKDADAIEKAIHENFEFVNTVTERALTQAKASEKAAQNAASAEDFSQAQEYAKNALSAKKQVDNSLLKANQHYTQMQKLKV